MKKFAKFFVAALAIAMIASVFAIFASAAQTVVDPHDLKPGSNAVYFIADPDENGNYPGDGTGRDAQNPYIPIEHENYDPEKKNDHYNTAIYQVTDLLKNTGGTIVICGPIHLDVNDGDGDHATTADVYTAVFGKNTIKFTSVYDGVDYRETNGAKITVEQPAELAIEGQSIWENIDIATIGTNRMLHCNSYPTLIGEGVNTYPAEEDYKGVASYYLSVVSGHRWNGGVDLTPTLVVQSGTYNVVTAAMWGTKAYRSENGKTTYHNDGMTEAKLVLEGTTSVLGQITGTTYKVSEYSGNTEIIINGGTYACDIFAVGATGMLNRDGMATLRINGGDFTKTWSLSPVAPGYLNNAPVASILDFTGWKGDMASLAAAYSVAKASETGFTSVKLPEGVTEESLSQAAAETTLPAVEETEAPSNEETNAPVVDNNNGGPVIIGGDANKDKETDATVDVGGQNGGSNTILIVCIIVGVVLIAAIVAVVILAMKLKKSKK